MLLEVIPLAQLWPDPNNPRKDFGDLDALADTFEMNAVRPFEPVSPPVVVPDGYFDGDAPAYRIVDGERRWRAMRKRGSVSACACIVCDMEEAQAMAAMVATDDKAPLTDAELSRGVQQMLAVGVAPEEVDKAARLRRGTARRVARVAREGTEQLSIAHLLAAESFNDEDARAMVLAAGEDSYEALAGAIRETRELAAAVAELRAACEEAGAPLVEDAPSADDGLLYRACARADGIAEAWGRMPEGSVGWICERAWGGPEVRFYGPRGDDTEAAHVRKLMADASESRSAWLGRQFAEREDFWLEMLPIVRAYEASRGGAPDPYNHGVGKWLEQQGIAGRIYETGHIVEAFRKMDQAPLWTEYVDGEVRPSGSSGDWLALGEAMGSLGYRPAPDEEELTAMVEAAIERFSEKKDETKEESDEREDN